MTLQLRRACALGLLVTAATLASEPTLRAQTSGAKWRGGNMIAQWDKPTLATQPSARTDTALGALGKVVLFGGMEATTPKNDTWEWTGTEWTSKTPATPPPARSDHAVATLGTHLVLFGGLAQGGAPLADTWEWDGIEWAPKSPAASPPARRGHAMSLFVGTKMSALLFGGVSATAQKLGDTWSWDGTNWTPVASAQSPTPRADHAMVTLGKKVVLFGGEDATGLLNDTWEWDGTNWSPKLPATSPPARARHAMAVWHARIVLFGGTGAAGALNDTWEWDGTTWAPMTAPTSPSKRAQHSMAPHSSGVVLFGGSTPADTWIYHSGLDAGSTCANSSDCALGHCVDAFCCDTACDGQCESCNQTGKLGTCTAVKGTPATGRPVCAGAVSCTSSCDAGDDACAPSCDAGTDPCRGQCDGVNRVSCTYPAETFVCVQAACVNAEEIQPALCSGNGMCSAPKKIACGDYKCEGLKCKTTCTTTADCTTGAECKNQKCEVPKPEGGVASDAAPEDDAPSAIVDAAVDTGQPAPAPASKNCGCRTVGASSSSMSAWLLIGAALILRKRTARQKFAVVHSEGTPTHARTGSPHGLP